MLIVVEILSVLLNLLYIYFAIKQKPISWIFGTIAAILSIYLFYQNDYIGSAALNVVYALLGLLGFFQWQFYLKDKIPEFRLSLKKHIVFISVLMVLFLIILFCFRKFHFSTMVNLDILLALGSILATFLEIRKDTSCWYYWIFLNIGFTVLYGLQKMYLYAALMLLLGIFSFFALKEWKKSAVAIF